MQLASLRASPPARLREQEALSELLPGGCRRQALALEAAVTHLLLLAPHTDLTTLPAPLFASLQEIPAAGRSTNTAVHAVSWSMPGQHLHPATPLGLSANSGRSPRLILASSSSSTCQGTFMRYCKKYKIIITCSSAWPFGVLSDSSLEHLEQTCP